MKERSENKICQNCKKDFTIESDDLGFYEKMKVPPPTFCPLCRAQRRLSFRNERKLFKVIDAFSGKEILSTYPKESGRKVISRETWLGDGWEAMDYGRDIDWSRPFLEQLHKLELEVPMYNFNVIGMVNSPYAFNASRLKNCYLLCNSNESEDCMYGNGIDFCQDCIDNSHITESERCYECFWLRKCYQCYFTIMSWDSRNLWFCRDCGGCSDCFGCANLRGKSYCIFNQQYTKEEYQQKLKDMALATIAGIENARKLAHDFWQTHIRRHQQGVRNLNSTGSYVTDCKNVRDSYLVRESENLRYCQYLQVPASKDSYDVTNWGEYVELCYETMECGQNPYNVRLSRNCWPTCRNLEYCVHLFSSSDCFGCVGLKKKQYCILNKQYTKEEYETLVLKLRKHMIDIPYVDSKGITYPYGEFFPLELAPFGYNNTLAAQHFPLQKEEALSKGYGWIDRERGEYAITMASDSLPSRIQEISDDLLKEVIECEKCKFAYKIQPNELQFYRKENLPIPHLCNECRHERRISDRLTLHLHKRQCMCNGIEDETFIYKNSTKHEHGDTPCGEVFKTGYGLDCPEIVYCEKCYQQEVY